MDDPTPMVQWFHDTLRRGSTPHLRVAASRAVSIDGQRAIIPSLPATAKAGDHLSLPVKHTVGRYFAPHDGLEEGCAVTRHEPTERRPLPPRARHHHEAEV